MILTMTFWKKTCRRCNRKIEKDFSYCPYCGYNDKADEIRDYGMLGKNDFFEDNKGFVYHDPKENVTIRYLSTYPNFPDVKKTKKCKEHEIVLFGEEPGIDKVRSRILQGELEFRSIKEQLEKVDFGDLEMSIRLCDYLQKHSKK